MRKLKVINLYRVCLSIIVIFGLIWGFVVNVPKVLAHETKKMVNKGSVSLYNINNCRYESTIRKQKGIPFKVTFYDLSLQSCGKKKSNPAYGISRGGYNLRNKNWKSARLIAVDPKIIPLHSVVFIKFKDEKYQKFTGTYIAGDTGSAIKGNHIDLFYKDTGEKVSQEAIELGVTEAEIIIIKEGKN